VVSVVLKSLITKILLRFSGTFRTTLREVFVAKVCCGKEYVLRGENGYSTILLFILLRFVLSASDLRIGCKSKDTNKLNAKIVTRIKGLVLFDVSLRCPMIPHTRVLLGND